MSRHSCSSNICLLCEQMAYVSVLMAVLSFIAYDWFLSQGVSQNVASTLMINIIVMSKIFYLFNMRSAKPLLSKDFFTNKMVFIIIGVMIVLQVNLIYVPFMQTAFGTASISPIGWAITIESGLIVLIITEIGKYLRIMGRKAKA